MDVARRGLHRSRLRGGRVRRRPALEQIGSSSRVVCSRCVDVGRCVDGVRRSWLLRDGRVAPDLVEAGLSVWKLGRHAVRTRGRSEVRTRGSRTAYVSGRAYAPRTRSHQALPRTQSRDFEPHLCSSQACRRPTWPRSTRRLVERAWTERTELHWVEASVITASEAAKARRSVQTAQREASSACASRAIRDWPASCAASAAVEAAACLASTRRWTSSSHGPAIRRVLRRSSCLS